MMRPIWTALSVLLWLPMLFVCLFVAVACVEPRPRTENNLY